MTLAKRSITSTTCSAVPDGPFARRLYEGWITTRGLSAPRPERGRGEQALLEDSRRRSRSPYLIAILNSETARARAEQYQSRGQWGARDFDKVMFNLPIPRFDPGKQVHGALAEAAAEAERIAAAVELPGASSFSVLAASSAPPWPKPNCRADRRLRGDITR